MSTDKWTKISGLETNIFGLKNDAKKGSRFFYLEIPPASLEIPANLPGQFSLSRQISLHWAAAILKAPVDI